MNYRRARCLLSMEMAYPGYSNGPYFVRNSSDKSVPNSWRDLSKRCTVALTKPKDVQWEEKREDIEDSFLHDMAKYGMALHLMPSFPFGELSNLTSKHRTKTPWSPKQAVDHIVMRVQTSYENEGIWMNVFSNACLKDVLLREAEQQNTGRLPDPLERKGERGDWCQYLSLRNHDRLFYTGNVLGQYITNKSTLNMIVSTLVKNLRNYSPHFVMGESRPVEIAVIQRLMQACQVFYYDYDVQRIRSPGIIQHGTPNHLYKPGPLSHGFICVPKDFISTVDEFLAKKNGVASLSKLVDHLRDKLGVAVMDALWLIRHVSFRETDDLEVTPQHHWVFAYNREEDGSSLSGDKLEFSSRNMGTYLTRSLTSCENKCNISYSDERSFKGFLKKTIIALPFQCDLRDNDDMEYMCQKRCISPKEKMVHVRKHHGISPAEERMVNYLQDNNVVLKDLSLQSQEEWLEKHGLFGLFDEKRLMEIPNLGNLLKEFMTMHCTLLEAISQTDQAFENLKGVMEGVKVAKCELIADTPCEMERENIEKEIRAIDNTLRTYEKFLNIQQSMMLSEEDLVEYLTSWSKAVSSQQVVLSKVNRMRENIQEAKSRGARLGSLLTQEWAKEVESAGSNLATVSPGACLQNLKENSHQNERGFGMMYLAMAGQAIRHDKKASQQVMDTYLTNLHEGGFTPPSSMVSDQKKVTGKRRLEDRDPDDIDEHPGSTGCVPMYKALKYEEAFSDRPHSVKQFHSFVTGYEKVPKRAFDSRHISAKDLAKFVGGTKLLPGSDIAPVGKGSLNSVTTLELVDPRMIQVDLNDYRDLLFYLLWRLQNTTHKNICTFTEGMKVAFLNVLNIMFALSDYGNKVTSEALSRAIVMRASEDVRPTLHHIQRELWLLFLAAVTFLNRNDSGYLNGFFSVRFSKHGDASAIPVKIMPERAYDCHFTQDVSEHFDSFLFSCDEKNLQSTSGIPLQACYHDLVADQGDLVHSVQANFYMDKADSKSKPQLFAIEAGSAKERRKLTKKVFPIYPSPSSTPSQYMQSLPDLSKKSTQRNFDSTPCYAMIKEEECRAYDAEVNRFREQVCPICMEVFSSRPLEGLNCIYKQLEQDFRSKKGLSDNVVLEKSEKLLAEYLKMVSEQIEEKCRHGGAGVETNGMHLFHRECLLRYIQLEALNPAKKVITCPICNTGIFSYCEKQRIIENIYETASRLALAAENESIPKYSIDSLVNMKRDLVQGEDFVTRYFPSAIRNDDFVHAREDSAMLEDLYGDKESICKEENPMEREEGNSAKEVYVDMVVKKIPSSFVPREAVNLVPPPVCVY